ncbi:MAG: VOC family protein [Solirubrobacteraceae bacterium]|nr:VOC family protein [Solirubrobacteraceae bacterium]
MTSTETAPTTPVSATLPEGLRLGAVHLTVTDLDRSVAWYQRSLGLRVLQHDARVARLGDSTTAVLVLHEDPAAPRAGRQAGIYHYALLYPSRAELARAAQRLAVTRTPIEGASDHHTHEAIYLPDPDGIGIELAADRPRAAWPDHLGYKGSPDPLDFASLMESVAGQEPTERVADGLRMGHVHLHVGDVDRGLAFYRDLVGFEEKANLGSAAFVSAGGYHHHLGFNVWRGHGVPPVPDRVVGMREWHVALPTADDVAAVRARLSAGGATVTDRGAGFTVPDPWGNVMAVDVA